MGRLALALRASADPPEGSDAWSSAVPRLLAQGALMTTERRGGLVVRRPRRWCPTPLRRWLLGGLLARAERFAAVLPIAPVRRVLLSDGAALAQPFLTGARPLRSLSAAELGRPPVRAAISRFWDQVEACWQQTGWLPDVGGRVYIPWELYAPLRTDNVMLDVAGRCWLVDPGATAAFHCRRWPTARLHAALMLRALRHSRAQWSVLPTMERAGD